MSISNITETARYLTFKLGEELFAINVTQAREVLDMSAITKVPEAPDYMRGVVNVRGNAIPVIDLRLKFGLPQNEDTVNTRIIVIELSMDGESVTLGGIADSVHEVIELEANQILEPPTIGMRWRTDLIIGMGRRDENFIIILDINKVFSCEDLEIVSNIES